MLSRRSFITRSLTAAACGAIAGSLPALAKGLGLPLGLQLYSVREQLPRDYEGTLRMVAAAGYKEVEAAGYFDHTPQDVLRAMKSAGLSCVSSHYSYGTLTPKFDEILDFNLKLGTQYIICASPGRRPPVTGPNADVYTLDDWYFMADRLNAFGEKVSAAGLKLGYHNHTGEFSAIGGVIPYVELLKRTDPAHVTMEMDCGWVVVGGASPQEYLRQYPTRISMLHVKDFARPTAAPAKPEAYTVTELGRGYIDYRPIFAEAAKTGSVKHVFAEQEAYDIPVSESLKVDADYIRSLI